MGRFAHVVEAKVFGKGNYFPCLSAKYRVRVLECKGGENRRKQLQFIVECEVLEIIAPPVEKMDMDGKTVPIVGEKRSWYVDLSNDAGPGDMKAFIAFVLGHTDVDEVSEQDCEEVVSEAQPVAGLELVLDTFNRKTRAGGPFTAHVWNLPR